MNTRILCLVCAWSVPFFSMGENGPIILNADHNGCINWTTIPGDYTYSIEWRSNLRDDLAWQSSFSAMEDITPTNTEVSVNVPVYYRVVAHSNMQCQSMVDIFQTPTGVVGCVVHTDAVLFNEGRQCLYYAATNTPIYNDSFSTMTASTSPVLVTTISNINVYLSSVKNETKCDAPVAHRPVSSVVYHYEDLTSEAVQPYNPWAYSYCTQVYSNPSPAKVVTFLDIYLSLDLRGNAQNADYAYLRNNCLFSFNNTGTGMGTIDIRIPSSTNESTRMDSFVFYATCPQREAGDYVGYEISEGTVTQADLRAGIRYSATDFTNFPDSLRIVLKAATNNPTPAVPSISDFSFIYWSAE